VGGEVGCKERNNCSVNIEHTENFDIMGNGITILSSLEIIDSCHSKSI
jgi:hypothetical protein